MRKYLIIFAFAICSLFCGITISTQPVVAEETSQAKIYASDITVTSGNYAYIDIKAENFVDLASLELFVFYDSSVFEYYSYSTQYLMSGATTDVSTSTGEIGFRAITLNGINGNGNLWRLTLRTKNNLSAQTSTITLAVGEAYNTSLAVVNIATQNCKVTINEKPQTIKNVSFSSNISSSTLKQNDTLTINYYTYSPQNFASANFEINYDNQLLKLESADISSTLKTANGALYDINTDIAGYVNIAYACLNGISNYLYPAITLNFKVIENIATTTNVDFGVASIFDVDLNVMKSNEISNTFTLQYTEPQTTNPCVSLSNYDGYVQTFDVYLSVEGRTNLAAGDFIIAYDKEYLTCDSVNKIDEDDFLVVNPNYQNGIIKFSFICVDGVKEDRNIAKITFSAKKAGTSQATVIGNNLVDDKFVPVAVDFTNATLTYTVETEHLYGEPTYVWSDDNTTCTATRVCQYNPSHTETEMVDTTSVVTQNKTCTQPELTTYTATFTNLAFAQQIKNVRTADALNHNYVYSEIVWTDFTAQAVYVCSHDNSHKQHFDCEITSEVTQAPTCIATGIKIYTATYDTHTSTKEEVLEIDLQNHNWGDVTYTWSVDNVTCTATRTCKNDPSHVESETIATTNTLKTKASDLTNEIRTYKAQFVNAIFGTTTKDVEVKNTKLIVEPKTIDNKTITEVEVNDKQTFENGVDLNNIIQTIGDDSTELVIKSQDNTISFDSAVVQTLKDKNVTLSVSITEQENEIELNIHLGGVAEGTNLGGYVIVSIEYNKEVPEGKVLKIYYVDSNNNRTDMHGTLQDGKATFATTHFSKYICVLEDVNNDSISPIVIIVIIGAVLIIGVVITVVVVKRKKTKISQSDNLKSQQNIIPSPPKQIPTTNTRHTNGNIQHPLPPRPKPPLPPKPIPPKRPNPKDERQSK